MKPNDLALTGPDALTKRDFVAIAAMQGLAPTIQKLETPLHRLVLVRRAYQIADLMIEQSNETPGTQPDSD